MVCTCVTARSQCTIRRRRRIGQVKIKKKKTLFYNNLQSSDVNEQDQIQIDRNQQGNIICDQKV